MQSSKQRIDVGSGVHSTGMLSRKCVCGSCLSCWCLFCLRACNSQVWSSLLERICAAHGAATHCCASPLKHREQLSALLTAGAWHSCFVLCSSVMIWLEFRDVLWTVWQHTNQEATCSWLVTGFSLQHVKLLRLCQCMGSNMVHLEHIHVQVRRFMSVKVGAMKRSVYFKSLQAFIQSTASSVSLLTLLTCCFEGI